MDLFIFKSPDKAAERYGKVIRGWSEKTLTYLYGLGRAGEDKPQILPVLPTFVDKPAAHLMGEFWAPVLARIEETDPTIIFSFGREVTRMFFPGQGYATLRGKTHRWTHPKAGTVFLVCPMDHPKIAAPGANPALAPRLEGEWRGLALNCQPGYYCQVSGSEAAILFKQHFGKPFAFDLETKNNHWPPLDVETAKPKDHTFQAIRSEIIGWSFAFEEGRAYYCTADVEWVRGPLESPDWITIVHNALFEWQVLHSIEIDLRGYHDTKLMAYLLGKPTSHLKDLTWTNLGITQTKFTDVDWSNIKQVVQYGAADSDYTLRLYNIFWPLLQAQNGLLYVYENIDLPSIIPLSETQRDGFIVDLARLDEVRDHVRTVRKKAHAELIALAPDPDINLASNKDIGNWLYGDTEAGYWSIKKELKTRTHIKWHPPGLGLEIQSRTELGAPRVDINTLHNLDHPVADLFIVLASADKFLGGHVRTFEFLTQEDGRIHASYHLSGHWETDDVDKQNAPGTGRISSTGPNAQQITNYGDESRPYVFEWGQELRRCIVPADGFVFLEADFAQQEPRIAAMVSGDEYMNHLLQTADVYKPAAADLYHIEVGGVDKEQRQIGKRAWMAWLNRAGASGIQRAAWWLETEEANAWIETQHTTYATFTEWCAEQFAFLIKHGYVETYFGRRIYLPQSQSPNITDRDAAYRACIPGVIQGTGADVFKLCLKTAGPYIHSLGGRTPNLVHDAIMAEVPLDRVEDAVKFLKGMSESLMDSPLPIEVLQGATWSKLDLKEVF